RVCTFRIASRPTRSGRWTVTRRSKRPGRSRAGSRTSGRLVAASTMTASRELKPSMATRSWLSVCSRSSWPPPTDGVELVDEDDGRRLLARLLEQIAHAGGSHADDHLDELGATHAEKRDARLAGHGA